MAEERFEYVDCFEVVCCLVDGFGGVVLVKVCVCLSVDEHEELNLFEEFGK